jgi:ectoine hydroxylase-related dioxygenase (phytanoyl-CoA dioxygenase family)
VSLTDRERYLFDVQGMLVVRDVLTAEEIKGLNDALDANRDRRSDLENSTSGSAALAGTPRRQYWNTIEWPEPWCRPFRNLIAHSRIVPYLDGLLGRGWHLDHNPEVFEFEPGAQGHELHFGHWWIHPGVFYEARATQIRNGLIAVEFLLSDQPDGAGGFVFIPGSHKTNFVRPDAISTYERDQEVVANPTARAGDAFVFTEALTHGAIPWRADHVRRLVIHRYAAKTVQYGPGFHKVVFPDWVDQLSPAQRAALEPAHFYDRPEVNADGTVETTWDNYDRP